MSISRRISLLAGCAVLCALLAFAAGCGGGAEQQSAPSEDVAVQEPQPATPDEAPATTDGGQSGHVFGDAGEGTAQIELVNKMDIGITAVSIVRPDTGDVSVYQAEPGSYWQDGEKAVINYPAGTPLDIRFTCGDNSCLASGVELDGHASGTLSRDGDAAVIAFDD